MFVSSFSGVQVNSVFAYLGQQCATRSNICIFRMYGQHHHQEFYIALMIIGEE